VCLRNGDDVTIRCPYNAGFSNRGGPLVDDCGDSLYRRFRLAGVRDDHRAIARYQKAKLMTSSIDNSKDLARVFLARSNKIRLANLQLISAKEMNVSAMQEKLPCPQSTISHHLNLLYLAGLIVRRREHKEVFYSIADLSKHPLGKKSELTKAKSNAAKFGPAELALLQKTGQSNKLEELARVFLSLGHKTRLRILMILQAGGETNVTTILKKLEHRMGITSHHLKILRKGGLVVSREVGKQRFYSIADLSKHRLGRKPKTTLPGVNAARFGPAELAIQSL
jgi:ArsR family transcriptional regulator, lead/cadmium/zinc/bismuth-responsive transcriptional repressor